MYMYRSLAERVADQCRCKLRKLGNEHLVLSGPDFVMRLRNIQYTNDAQLAKLDLPDFYLEGKHHVLLALLGKSNDPLE